LDERNAGKATGRDAQHRRVPVYANDKVGVINKGACETAGAAANVDKAKALQRTSGGLNCSKFNGERVAPPAGVVPTVVLLGGC
jgi:hypothetical protein